MMESLHNLEPPTVDSTLPELEFDDINVDDMLEDDQRTPTNIAPPLHANGARFLTPVSRN